jgi:Zn-finger nucleic acid-binding protein
MVLHGCGQCGGLFVDIAGSRRLQKAFPMAATKLADRASAAARRSPDLLQGVACPVCQKQMTRTRLPDTTLDIDICGHGTWFDRDELRRAAEALHPVKPVVATPRGVGAPAHKSVYAQGLENLAAIADEWLQSRDPEMLSARIRRLERELGHR